MGRLALGIAFIGFGWFSVAPAPAAQAPTKPNVLLIYADDIGYGDLGCQGATRVKTPNVDRLAARGIRFRDGHSASGTCTPSRYALLTGEYPWRKPGTGILPGDAALIIDPSRLTLSKVFKNAGYATGVVGKWHLGLGLGKDKLDWNGPISPGPRDIGFDESFLIPATGDRVPTVYVRDGAVDKLDPSDPIKVSYGKPIGDEPTGAKRPDLLKVKPSHGHDQTIVNGVSRIGTMTGGKSARWVDEDMADTLAKEGVAFLERHAKAPFFLYFATHGIHVPRVPHPRFAGVTGMGPRGDAIAEFDATVGALMNALDRLSLTENTLVILTSDNGPVVDDGYQDDAVARLGDHRPTGPLRGGKYSLFEAGTRVPLLVSWPAKIKPGVSDALVCQIDFLASFSSLLKQTLPEAAAPDSMNVMPALLGDPFGGRRSLVSQGAGLAYREGNWKFIPAGRGAKVSPFTNIETGVETTPRLFDLSTDLGESNNLATKYPERVKAMAEALRAAQKATRTRP